MNTQQVHDLDLGIMTIGWQEVDILRGERGEVSGERFHGGSLRHTHLSSQVGYRWCEAHPYNVFHVNVVTEQPLFVVVDVNHTYQSITMLSEVIQERGVLSHRCIAVGGIVARCIVVAKQHDNTFAHYFFQFGTSPDIRIFAKHLSKNRFVCPFCSQRYTLFIYLH